MLKDITKVIFATMLFGLSKALCAFDPGAGPADQPAGASAGQSMPQASAAAQPIITICSLGTQFKLPKDIATSSNAISTLLNDSPSCTSITLPLKIILSLPILTPENLRLFIPVWQAAARKDNLEKLLQQYSFKNRCILFHMATGFEVPEIIASCKKTFFDDNPVEIFRNNSSDIPLTTGPIGCFAEGFAHITDYNYTDTPLYGHTQPVTSVAITPSKETIVSSDNKKTYVWSLQDDNSYTRSLLYKNDGETHSPTTVAINATGSLIATVDDNNLLIFEKQLDEFSPFDFIPLSRFNLTGPLALAEDKSIIACATESNILIFKRTQEESSTDSDSESEESISYPFSQQLLNDEDHPITALAVNENGTIIMACHQTTIVQWEFQTDGTYKKVDSYPAGELAPSNIVAQLPSALDTAYRSEKNPKFVTLKLFSYETKTEKIVAQFEHSATVNTVAISLGLPTIVTGSDDCLVHVWQAKNKLLVEQPFSYAQIMLIKLILASENKLLDLATYPKEHHHIFHSIIASFNPESRAHKFINTHILNIDEPDTQAEPPAKRPRLHSDPLKAKYMR